MKCILLSNTLTIWAEIHQALLLQFSALQIVIFFCIRTPPGLLPVMGPLERYMTPTLDAALLISLKVFFLGF